MEMKRKRRWRDAEELELAKYADGVVRPVADGVGTVFCGYLTLLVEEITVEAVEIALAGRDGGRGEEGDRHGEN